MVDYLKSRWKQSGRRWFRAALVICVLALAAVTLRSSAQLTDTDGDGMPDTYELFFGLNPTNSADAFIDSDSDVLLNQTESGLWTDPFCKDTDRDGWMDSADVKPLSRAVMMWGTPKFSTGTNYNYTGPSWWIGGEMTGGYWLTNAWTVSQQVQGPVSLRIPIVRSLLTNDLTMSLTFMDQYGAMYIDLIRTNGVTDTNLFGNLMYGSNVVVTRTYQIPVMSNSQLGKIQIRRDYGMAMVYSTMLYIDRDGDGLDDDQEVQAGTDPLYTNGIQATIPGILQAEDFGPGGEGRGYHDTTAGNSGGQYRTNDSVDIEACLDNGGGYDVTGTRAGEWMCYTVLVTNEASYNVSARVASPTNGGAFHVAVDGYTVSGTVSVPKTGGTQSWYSVQLGSVYLGKGLHVIRLTMDAEPSGGSVGNFNYLKVTQTGVNQPPEPDAGPDQVVTSPAPAMLTAGYSDDALPTGAVYAVSWSKQSGPGTVSFTNVSSTSARAYFGLTGVYLINCMVSDGLLTGTDAVQITVNPAPVNTAPVVYAGTNQTIALPAPANISGTVTDDTFPSNYLVSSWSKFTGPGNVTFGNSNLLITTASFSTGGTYVLQLTASDGQLSGNSTVWITVSNAPPANSAPMVNAGLNQTITLPAGASLSGTATDDGLPSNKLTVAWSKFSGPGTVSFGNSNAPVTTANFTTNGVYVLQLVANDTALASTSAVTITVNPAVVSNVAPTVSAGSPQTITLPSTASLLGTANDDSLPSNKLTVAWSKFSGPGTVTFGNSNAPVTTASFTTNGVYVLQLVANDTALASTSAVTVTVNPAAVSNAAPTVSAGSSQTITLPSTASLLGTANDDSLPSNKLTVAWSKFSGPGTVTFGNSNAPVTTANFTTNGVYVLQLVANDTALASTSAVTITVNPAVVSNVAPTVSAGSPQTITLPSSANLSGTASDDNLPSNKLTVAWSKFSGPGTVSFGNSNAPVTTANFTTNGVYVLQLVANDTALASTSAVTVTVNPAAVSNAAPTVSAGSSQTITLPSTASLLGTANDDSLPSNKLTVAWSKFSGPGTVSFGNSNTLLTTASFTMSGVYVLQLVANDTALSSTGTVTITVNPPANAAPLVNAGTNQTITMPALANLSGTMTDDGLPSNNVTVAWSKSTGPGNVTFANSNALVTTASFQTGGTYVLQLSANDGQYSAFSTVWITVSNPVVSATALVGQWSFEQTAWTGAAGEVVDTSGSSNHGRAVNGAMTTNAGVSGRAACFNATNQYIEVPNSTSLQVNADLSLSFWVKPSNIGVQRVNPIDKNYGGEFSLAIETDGRLSYYHGSAPGPQTSWSLQALPAGSLVNGLWQHIAIVRSMASTNVSCYLNGKLVTQSPCPPYMLIAKTTNALRMANGNTGQSMNGCLDEVAIYARSLSAAEVNASYLTTRPTNQAPVVDAGPDMTVTSPAPASLSGFAADDGLPSGVLTSMWSKAGGPGTVNFTSPTSRVTTATFTTGGVYVLQLIAGDGATVSTDTVQVTVVSVPPTAPAITAFAVGSTSNFHNEGTVTMQTTATDVNGDVISYQFGVDSSVVSVWSTNRVASWAPGLTNFGARVFTASVKDPGGLTSQLSQTNFIYMTPPRP